ncbi:phosphopantothenoylcysteine decarboxylase / phosphopantothenate--cysteine ligase [Spirosomataceae bacterium TFI 002]|nr:phosphopantothenoylcysteine decarboxylase / phosphopantothenate--cysteine ligase [Spirosomataceae bacterium TFI 002]
MLKGKKILLGVSGSIAAYKAGHLVRLLVKEEAEVKVIMTTAASEFITPLTLSTLSKNPVAIEFVKNNAGEWNNHVELGLWADLMLIAPASANTLSKCANGICDNLLIATYLSARCPVFFAPAMDLDMFAHQSTVANLSKLKTFGNQIIDAESGELASGLEGKGRMAEPENIVKVINSHFNQNLPLKGKKVLITAGPTQEAIDPVRFISNHSSGKMAYSIAEVFQKAGAEVLLISGPVNIPVPSNCKKVDVKSANDMLNATLANESEMDVMVFAAAVADYAPSQVADQKIKKSDEKFSLEMSKTKDIALEIGKIKKPSQLSVGFALETNNEEENALKKLSKKNFNFIVLNSLQDKGAGFRYDTNQIKILRKDGSISEFPLKTKTEVAADILDEVLKQLKTI